MDLSTITSRMGTILVTGFTGLFGSGEEQSADRRAYTRIRARFRGSIDWEGRRIPVRGIDLHRAGTGISLDEPLPPGALVFFYGRTHGLMGWATVRWCACEGGSKYHAGLEFRSGLMRAEAGNWHFSYVQSSHCPAGIAAPTN